MSQRETDRTTEGDSASGESESTKLPVRQVVLPGDPTSSSKKPRPDREGGVPDSPSWRTLLTNPRQKKQQASQSFLNRQFISSRRRQRNDNDQPRYRSRSQERPAFPRPLGTTSIDPLGSGSHHARVLRRPMSPSTLTGATSTTASATVTTFFLPSTAHQGTSIATVTAYPSREAESLNPAGAQGSLNNSAESMARVRKCLAQALPEFWHTVQNHPERAAVACQGLQAVLRKSDLATKAMLNARMSPSRNDGRGGMDDALSTTSSSPVSTASSPIMQLQSPPRMSSLASAAVHATIGSSTPASAWQPWPSKPRSPDSRGHQSRRTSSSRILPWLLTSTDVDSDEIMGLDKDQEDVTAPFFLLAAAQVAFSDLQHISELDIDNQVPLTDSRTRSSLSLLYEHVAVALVGLQQRFCNLNQSSEEKQEGKDSDSVDKGAVESKGNVEDHQEAKSELDEVNVVFVSSLQSILNEMIAFCTRQSNFVQLQQEQFLCCQSQIMIIDTTGGGNGSGLLSGETTDVSYPSYEYKSWELCVQAVSAMERCKFFDAILTLRRFQNSLPNHQNTRMARWFHSSYLHLQSLLDVYFDRVRAFAGPLYGFDVSAMSSTTKKAGTNEINGFVDWNGRVVDFLRKQEKTGGPPTIISIVLDAARAENFFVERGMQLSGRRDNEQQPYGDNSARVWWPAIYVRSTMYYGGLSKASGGSTASSGAGSGSGILSGSQSNLLSAWSSSPPPPKNKKANKTAKIGSIMEYGPQAGTVTSWPHSEWELLADHLSEFTHKGLSSILDQRLDGDDAVSKGSGRGDSIDPVIGVKTFHAADEAVTRGSMKSIEEAMGIFGSAPTNSYDGSTSTASLPPAPDTTPGSSRREIQSSSVFHIAPVSDCLFLVAIVKGEESNRWHRRRTSITDEDFRSYLFELSTEIRASKIFTRKGIPSGNHDNIKISLAVLNQAMKETEEEQEEEDDRGDGTGDVAAVPSLTEDDIEEFLDHVKAAFTIQMTDGTKQKSSPGSPFGRHRRRQKRIGSPRRGRPTSYSDSMLPPLEAIDESAKVLFLGDLAQFF